MTTRRIDHQTEVESTEESRLAAMPNLQHAGEGETASRAGWPRRPPARPQVAQKDEQHRHNQQPTLEQVGPHGGDHVIHQFGPADEHRARLRHPAAAAARPRPVCSCSPTVTAWGFSPIRVNPSPRTTSPRPSAVTAPGAEISSGLDVADIARPGPGSRSCGWRSRSGRFPPVCLVRP